EPGTFKDGMRAKLKEKGHHFKSVGRQYGNMHAILWDKKSNTLMAASDRRGSGLAIVETVGINE
ncbi:MAG: gamma-glutamyltransferase, partial [Cycloclasticus sp.]